MARAPHRPIPQRLVVGLALVGLLAGCASLPPAKPVTSLGQIAGKWQGVFRSQGGQQTVIKEQTIRPDGTWESLTPGSTPERHTGVVQLVDGKLRGRSATSGRTSTWTLHEGEGKRVLMAVNDDGSGAAELTPAKP
jgi:hypothetical protein